MSVHAASYHVHDTSFGIEHIYMDDKPDVSYNVTCELSKADCKIAPDSVCDAVSSEVIFQDEDRRALLSFEDAFDGDSEAKVYPRRLMSCKPHLAVMTNAGTTHQHDHGVRLNNGKWLEQREMHTCPLFIPFTPAYVLELHMFKCVLCTCSSNTGGWHGTYSNCATYTARNGHRGFGPFTCHEAGVTTSSHVRGDLTFKGHGTPHSGPHSCADK